MEGPTVYVQAGGRSVIDVDIEGAHAAGGVVDLELICACLCDRNRRKRNGVLVAGTVVSYVGSTRAETAAADAGRAAELCRLRLVRGEIRSDRTSVTGADNAIEIRGVGSGIAEDDRIITRKQGARRADGCQTVYP